MWSKLPVSIAGSRKALGLCRVYPVRFLSAISGKRSPLGESKLGWAKKTWSSPLGVMSSTRSFKTSRSSLESHIIKVPTLADSITEGEITKWHKKVGEYVNADETVATVETDKVDIEINSTHSGIVEELFFQEGATIQVGENLLKVKLGGAPPKTSKPQESKPAETKPTPAKADKPKAPLPEKTAAIEKPKPAPISSEKAASPSSPKASVAGARSETRVKMSRMRLKIAQRLKEAQNTYALLTTFNEVDMSNIIDMRNKLKDQFLKKHGVKLGFMSAFVASSVRALKDIPTVNAHIEGSDIIYRDYIDISVAVASPKGLVVPVIRDCNNMTFADIEKSINALALKARDNDIAIEDMAGGTFTISNGGVFGSLMGTPIVNPPQSAILGMHGVFDRPVAINGKVEIRPMMYIALTYDHRIIDGREAVTFLKTIKEYVEDPRRLLVEC